MKLIYDDIFIEVELTLLLSNGGPVNCIIKKVGLIFSKWNFIEYLVLTIFNEGAYLTFKSIFHKALNVY